MLLNGIYLPYKQQKSEVRSNVGESASNDFSYILYHLDCRVGNNLHAECDRAGATTEQFCYNLSKTLTQANSPENVYCRSCVDKIEKYINCDMAITERTYITDKPGK